MIFLLSTLLTVLQVQATYKETTYQVDDGGVTLLNCTNNETKSTMIYWEVEGINLNQLTNPHNISWLFNFNVSENNLIIQNPRSSEIQGPFNVTCIFNSTNEEIFQVFLLKAARILTQAKIIPLAEYEKTTISIACETTGYPTPYIEWKFDTYVLNATQKPFVDTVVINAETKKLERTTYQVLYNGTLLILNPLSPDHVTNENFTCVAKNMVGEDSRRHRVLFLTSTDKETTYQVDDGGVTLLNCINSETKSTMIYWEVEGINLNQLTNPHNISWLFNFNVSENNLIIQNPRSSEIQGPFNVTCIFNSTNEEIFHVFLLKAARILTQAKIIPLASYEKTNISIACETTGYPTPYIEWKFDTYVLNATQNPFVDTVVLNPETKKLETTTYQVLYNGTLLILNPLSPDHVTNENFTCVAKNMVGEDSRRHRVFFLTLVSYVFEVEVTLNGSSIHDVMLKIEHVLRKPSYYKVNIMPINSSALTAHFEIIWTIEIDDNQNVQKIADDLWKALKDVLIVKKFIMKGAPGPPTDLEVISETTSEISIRWKHPRFFIVDNYQILTKTGSSAWRNHDLIDGNQMYFILKNLESDTKYIIKMYGTRDGKNGVESKIVEGKTKDSAPVAIIVSVVVIVVIIVIGLVLGVLYYRKKPRERTIVTFAENPYQLSLPGVNFSNIYTQEDRTYCPVGNDGEQIQYFSWQEISHDNLNMGEVLGYGEFGMVVKAVWFNEKENQYIPVGVKTIRGNATETDQKELFKELKLMAEVSLHKNIVNLVGACSAGGNLSIIVEFCENGELLKYLRKPENRNGSKNSFVSAVAFVDRLKIAFDISKGMSHLEGKKVVHRDLAARNILLGRNYVAKVSDFGLSRDIYELGLYEKKTAGKLPVKWMAIESLQEAIYTSKSDVWSFGILVWEIESAGMTPYPGIRSSQELIYNLKNGSRLDQPTVTPDEVYDMMISCWEDSPKARPTFHDLEARLEEMLVKHTDYLPVLNEPTDNDEDVYLNQSIQLDGKLITNNDKLAVDLPIKEDKGNIANGISSAEIKNNDYKDNINTVNYLTVVDDGVTVDDAAASGVDDPAYVNQGVQIDGEKSMTTTC